MKKDYSDFTLILAFQRSGTTALRSIFEASDKYFNFGEIFAPQRTQMELGVYNYFEKVIQQNSKLVYPLFENRVAFFDLYFEALRNESNRHNKKPLIDVKYDVLYNLHTFFMSEDVEPFFIKYCKMRKVKIVHLLREDSLEIALSLAIARKNKQYHYTDSESPIGNLTLDKKDVFRFYQNHIKQKNDVQSFLETSPHLEISYEKAFKKNSLTDDTISLLSSFININLKNIESNYVKKAKSNKELVSNFHEIRNFIFK
ncbi:hypothetical protein [Paraglaciecola sp.]|uniref:hypothetical protein n=1 Tax=Paraglaciecola sp. TaxID=1920173 RepID=UPI003266584D